jgi:hypothetical protein
VDGDEPTPLPNLDFKIEQGDSLTAPNPELMVGQGFRGELIRQFREAKANYMTSHGGDKRRLKDEAESLKKMINEWTRPGKNAPPVAGFDWAVEFAELWDPDSKGDALADGFDIVVANPPYVRHELIQDLKPTLRSIYQEVYAGTADLYCYFYGRAVQLLRPGGMLAFISPNKWFLSDYGARLRDFMVSVCRVRSITDFGDLPVFESATAYPMIFVAQKAEQVKDGSDGTVRVTRVGSLDPPYPDVLAITRAAGRDVLAASLRGAPWTFATRAGANVRTVTVGKYVGGRIYYGIKTGFNTAFYLDGATRQALIRKDPKSEELIKPLAVGRDIKRWRIRFADRWQIVTKIGVDMRRYPAVFDHLKQWQSQLEVRYDQGQHWWELRPCEYYDAFDEPKIVYPQILDEPNFAYDGTGAITNQKCFIIANVDMYLLGILNSRVVWRMIKQGSPELRGGYAEPRKDFILSLPIPEAPDNEREAIADLVQSCLDAYGVDCEEWEREINERVARLYGLTLAEVGEM